MKRVFLMLSMLTLGELKASAVGSAEKEVAEVEVWIGRTAKHVHHSKDLISYLTLNHDTQIRFSSIKVPAGQIALAQLKKLGAAAWKADAEKMKFLKVSSIVEYYDDKKPSRGTYAKFEKNVEWDKGYVNDASVQLSEKCMFLMLDEQEQASVAGKIGKETAAANK